MPSSSSEPSSEPFEPSLEPFEPFVSTYAVLQHPFTYIVAECTRSGKTVWVKTLLEDAQKTISPPPQRIIWCYGQWQPSYFDMMKTMPGIEFNQRYPRRYRRTRLYGRISAQLSRFGRSYGSIWQRQAHC